jgi:peroxiredoxin Q/BCP
VFARTLRLLVLGCGVGVLAGFGGPAAAGDPGDKTVDLKVGDQAPAFEAPADQGGTWSSADHVGKGWVVVYFYPGDFTPGCMAQAKAFRDAMNGLKGLGVEVVGVSGDSVRTHEQFRAAQGLNFTLLADEDGALARKFGVPVGPGGKVRAKDADGKVIEIQRAATAARWTFILGKDGKVAYKNTKVVPANDAKAVAEFIGKAGAR